MIVHVPGVLATGPLTSCRQLLQQADWQDGRGTAGFQSALVKNNPAARRFRTGAAGRRADRPGPGPQSALHVAALPARIFPKLFNVYGEGQSFGLHVDNAIRYPPGAASGIRTDLSATLFLSEPDSYDGGELVIQDTYGEHAVKLPAGDMVLYPAGSLHRVTPVTRGMRLCSFFWIQSMIRDDGQRGLLFDLDGAIQDAGQQLGAGHGVVVRRPPHTCCAAGRIPSASPPQSIPGVPDAAGPAAEGGLRRHPRSGEPPPCPCRHLRTRPKNCV